MIVNQVMIGALIRIKARMKHRLNHPRPAHGNGFGQKCVDPAHTFLCIALKRYVKMHHLSLRMDTGIGATGALYGFGLVGELV